MKYAIQVTNIQGRVSVVKVVRGLNPGTSLVEAKNYVWEKATVNLSQIRRERNPGIYENDYVFTEGERTYVQDELRGLCTIIVDTIPYAAELEQMTRIERIFKAGFEAGIASDLDVYEAWEKFQQDFANGIW